MSKKRKAAAVGEIDNGEKQQQHEMRESVAAYLGGKVTSPALLQQYRDDTVAKLEALAWVPKVAGCAFSNSEMQQVLQGINDWILGGTLPDIRTSADFDTSSIPCQEGVLAYYEPRRKSIMQCCETLSRCIPLLPLFHSVPLEDKLLDYSSKHRAFISLIEHELVHYLLDQYAPPGATEAAHGPRFITLVRNLFGHGWGDLALVEIGKFLSGQPVAEHPAQFDDAYRREVMRRLNSWGASRLARWRFQAHALLLSFAPPPLTRLLTGGGEQRGEHRGEQGAEEVDADDYFGMRHVGHA